MLSSEEEEGHNWIFSADQMQDEGAGIYRPLTTLIGYFLEVDWIAWNFIVVLLVCRWRRTWLAFLSRSRQHNWSFKWGSWPNSYCARGMIVLCLVSLYKWNYTTESTTYQHLIEKEKKLESSRSKSSTWDVPLAAKPLVLKGIWELLPSAHSQYEVISIQQEE